MGKGEIARNEQFLLLPQCFLLNQIIVFSFVHIFDIISLFAAELEKPNIGISGQGLSSFGRLFFICLSDNTHTHSITVESILPADKRSLDNQWVVLSVAYVRCGAVYNVPGCILMGIIVYRIFSDPWRKESVIYCVKYFIDYNETDSITCKCLHLHMHDFWLFNFL